MIKKLWLLLVVSQITISTNFAQVASDPPFYKINVKIEPSSGTINCVTQIQNPKDSCFVLNKDMEIKSIIADGKPVSYEQKSSDFMQNASEVDINSPVPKNVIFEYSGKLNAESLPPIISSVNMINSKMVELAFYVTWYPRAKNSNAFNFELQLDIPSNFSAVTNASLENEKTENGRTITTWESFFPGADVAILAAPGLQKSIMEKNGTTVEIYYEKLSPAYIDSMKNNLIQSMEMLTNLYGPLKANSMIRVGYSPRGSWGYVRTPFIIVSEEKSLSWRSQKFGPARDFRYLTHEIAHYWWLLANTGTPEDWLNEGLAEFSAFYVSEKLIGKEFSEEILNEYKNRVDNSNSKLSIVETPSSSRDRELNRYDKPVIFFNEAMQRFGEQKLFAFLKSLYKRFSESKNVNTDSFLDEAEKQLGPDAKQFFYESLHRTVWNTAKTNSEYLLIPADSVFIGTWKGIMKIQGQELEVVLHLKNKDNKLFASLDSPAQNVKDIPVAEAKLNGDAIALNIAVASAIYSGKIQKENLVIEGEWKQAGTVTSLILKKSE